MPEDLLKLEKQTYASMKASLLAQGLGGKWIVLLGDQRLGVFDDPADAHAKGIEVAGLDRPFLLKQIGTDDDAQIPAFLLGLIHAGR